MNSRLFRFDFDRTHFGDHGLESSTISCPADTLYSALCVEALRMGGQQLLGELNRPGMSGDSSSWKGWGHVRWFIEEVPAGAA
ncbi:Csm4 family CRISPR-associated ramp protein [Mycobacterium tuberculosis]|nr:Csm4 family CRISPR-associated ramp protein [Mycobacterium tuberculosis]